MEPRAVFDRTYLKKLDREWDSCFVFHSCSALQICAVGHKTGGKPRKGQTMARSESESTEPHKSGQVTDKRPIKSPKSGADSNGSHPPAKTASALENGINQLGRLSGAAVLHAEGSHESNLSVPVSDAEDSTPCNAQKETACDDQTRHGSRSSREETRNADIKFFSPTPAGNSAANIESFSRNGQTSGSEPSAGRTKFTRR